jgi:hypothetical protein
VASNLNFSGPDDLTGTANARYSLIGDSTGAAIVDGGSSLIGPTAGAPIDPRLGPLADNGGPTRTRTLLANSPAIDRGDPAAAALLGVGNIPLHDQRGAPYTRAFDGDGLSGARVDIGAFEVQSVASALPGDYNANNVVDAADYVLWRNSLDTTVPAFTSADGNGDGVVNQADYSVWRANFGKPAAGAGASEHVSVAERSIADVTRIEPQISQSIVKVIATTGGSTPSGGEAQVLASSTRPKATSNMPLRSTTRARSAHLMNDAIFERYFPRAYDGIEPKIDCASLASPNRVGYAQTEVELRESCDIVLSSWSD